MPQTRDAILANPLYQNITGKFVQSHDYIAMERLYEIHASGRYDLIIVDTPPTRNAIDFLEAPERMADFFSSRLLRWLITPYRSRLVNAASRPFYNVADRILGSQFLQDIAEFFILFQTDVRRLRRAGRRRHPHARGSPHHVRRRDHARDGAGRARPSSSSTRSTSGASTSARSCSTRCCRRTSSTTRPPRSAEVLCRKARRRSRPSCPPRLGAGESDQVARVLREVGESFLNYRVVATREAEQRKELGRVPDVVAAAPFFETDIYDLAGLLRLGDRIWR